MRSALRISVAMGCFTRRPAHQASARPATSTTRPSIAASAIALRSCVRRRESYCERAATVSGEVSKERTSTSSSPSVCGVLMPGSVCTSTRTGTAALRVIMPAGPASRCQEYSSSPPVLRTTTPNKVSSRWKYSALARMASRSPVITSSAMLSAMCWATSPARRVSSPATRLLASAAAVSTSAVCCIRLSKMVTDATARATRMAAMTATAMYLLLKLTMLTVGLNPLLFEAS